MALLQKRHSLFRLWEKSQASSEISVSNESNETCVELRRIRFDETNIPTDARLNRLVECQHELFE